MASVLLPASVLASPTPSALDGVAAAVEARHRAFGCELAQEMGVLLCMPQACMATAQALLQRFYFRRSLRLFAAHVAAMSCLFLAGKVEEHTRAIRDILNVCFACKLRRQGRTPQPLLRGGELYVAWKLALIRCERFVLIDLGFQMYAVSNAHPHKFILYYVKALGGGDALAQRAWSYLNDSLRLDLCVRHAPEAVACAALLLAARDTASALPASTPWTAVFSSDRAEVEAIASRIETLYDIGVEEGADAQWPQSLAECVGESAPTSALVGAPR